MSRLNPDNNIDDYVATLLLSKTLLKKLASPIHLADGKPSKVVGVLLYTSAASSIIVLPNGEFGVFDWQSGSLEKLPQEAVDVEKARHGLIEYLSKATQGREKTLRQMRRLIRALKGENPYAPEKNSLLPGEKADFLP